MQAHCLTSVRKLRPSEKIRLGNVRPHHMHFPAVKLKLLDLSTGELPPLLRLWLVGTECACTSRKMVINAMNSGSNTYMAGASAFCVAASQD